MRMKLATILPSVIVLMISMVTTMSHAQKEPRYSHTGPTIISGIRVIDGLGNAPRENQDILLAGGRIAAIGPASSVDAPTDALRIDGAGLTAMPGLIDMHVHIKGGWANGTLEAERYQPTYDDETVQQALSGHLYSGVTTVLEVGADDHEWGVRTRDRINEGELPAPRTFTSGAVWSQEPSGWGAPAGPTMVTDIEAIPGQMDRYEKDGIEILKLYTGLSPHAAQFVVAEAHKRNMLVIADFWQVNMDKIVMQATGLDGWVHSSPEAVSAANNKWLADNDRFIIVTANVGEMLSGLRVADEEGNRSMLQEPLIVDIWARTW